ncbi:Signal transduction protein [Mycena venus]|uniref:Signal transduction protein n=1 Tax=Mycena venus TaxID=2733690 RepID=A0A8H6YFN5_9AGAR|nr:Signal transduction protein [Mycena venus]
MVSQTNPEPVITSEASDAHSISAGSLHPTISAGSIKSSPNNHDSETIDPSAPILGRDTSTASQHPQRAPFHRARTLPASIDSIDSQQRPPDRGRALSFSRMFSSSNSVSTRRRFSKLVGPKLHPYSELKISELYPLLSPLELAFFTTLDAELEKIEDFYVAREKEMKIHTDLLELQLNELDEHRKLFNATYPSAMGPSTSNASPIFKLKAKLVKDEEAIAAKKDKGKATAKKAAGKFSETATPSSPPEGSVNSTSRSGTVQLNPDEFHNAKHQLKKAVLEHYRGLETLHNYRILNITGIRKALKKFQKVTKIAAQKAYMTEKVDKAAFASETKIRAMMDEMEEVYAARFAHGDRKRALTRLRSGPQHKSHHISTFWSGLFVGLAVPAFVAGLYQSFRPSVRDSIPGWDGLLFIYGVFFIPVVFSVLVGFNILVWANSRINYVFIFELDLRTRLDHREYFGIPTVLLAALCYSFWLSFAQIGAPSVSPTIWPLVWLGFAGIIMLDPFPILFKPSRVWLLKNVAKLLASGTRRVEFADFWMGDQFCSLVFTLSNLSLVVCLYIDGFNSNWQNCGSGSRFWPLSFTLTILPFLVRLIQSIKRYVDSGLDTHLINGGKYGAGIVSYLCYFIWRHRGGHGATFAVWVIFQVHNLLSLRFDLGKIFLWIGLYCAWTFNTHCYAKNWCIPITYTSLYYFAIVSNTLIRFIWVLYIPSQGPNMMLRTFIGGSFEMLRRVQWNFYRVENEHVGNVDQYRVTREVPLPYSLYEPRGGDADDDEDDGSPPRACDHNVTPPGPGGAVATNRYPKITLPQLVVRQPTNPSSLGVPSPIVETGTLNSGRAPKRTRPALVTRLSNTSHVRSSVPASPIVSPSSVAGRVVQGFVHLMGPSPLGRHPYSSLSLQDLIPLLSPHELAFFSALDIELQKVEDFYLTREKEMKTRTKSLEAQLRELNEHRKLFDVRVWQPTPQPRGHGSRFSTHSNSSGVDSPLRATHMENSAEIPEDTITADMPSGLKRDEDRIESGPMPDHLDPKAYLAARRKLKKAVLEHYRGLEMLHNYRILNIYGFRRVLNKFEKATKIPAQRAYMEAKVEKCSFFSDETLRAMMDEMQNTFAASFAQGDRNKAMTRLRAGPQYKSHHNSTFWSGLAIGSALAALGSGIAHSFEHTTREAIPGWDGLLFIYGVLAVPTVFALLVGLNLLVWARARINYVFIFELDLRTRLDHREYFQFTDFWMGDQFCSLVFTLSNIPLIGCVYSQGLNADWRKCGSVSKLWPLAFVLAVLPFLVRLIQSFRRYADSRLPTHLINAGKYGAGIVNYLCYFIWRHRGGHYDTSFAFWILSNSFYTTYALIWDFLMDWSILRLHSRHFLLRQELVYTNHIFMYYLAIATNTLIRFLWVFYIPVKGPDTMLRSFVVGLLEIVRRWQWNFL